MKAREFRRQLDLEVEPEEVFRWHERPGAFERLGPPWDRVQLDGPAARLVPGERQEMVVPIGPLRLRWRAEIRDVDPGKSFQDVQLSGPFASWEHTHTMRAGVAGGSQLEDRVRYRLPLGLLGSVFGGPFARNQIERLFAYRHRITRQDLARHAGAGAARPLDVLITGSTGLVGGALRAFLTTGGHRARRLVRRAPRAPDEFRWDPESAELDPAALAGVDAVVHLAGENIAARRWSPQQKERIRRSRVEGTRALVEALRAAPAGPRTLVSASAIGLYGDRGDELLDEESAPGTGFLAEVGQAWEAEARRLEGARCVQLRFGVVLSPAGGALAKMLLPFQLGAGGRIGSGRQWMSWVALDDVIGAIHHALFSAELEGPVNVVAPEAVTNADYTRTLGRVLGRPTLFPMPAAAARLAFGELADALLLGSQRVLPRRLQQTGYDFAYPTLEGALRHQLGKTLE